MEHISEKGYVVEFKNRLGHTFINANADSGCQERSRQGKGKVETSNSVGLEESQTQVRSGLTGEDGR